MEMNDYKELNEKLRNILKKYRQEPLVDMQDMQDVIHRMINDFSGGERALSLSLISISHCLKHLAELCEKYEKHYWKKIENDEVLQMPVKYAMELMRVRAKSRTGKIVELHKKVAEEK